MGSITLLSGMAGPAGTVWVETPITREDAGDVVRDFREGSKLGSSVTLRLADSFDALLEEVRKAAEDAGGTKDNAYTVLHKDGSIWRISYSITVISSCPWFGSSIGLTYLTTAASPNCALSSRATTSPRLWKVFQSKVRYSA